MLLERLLAHITVEVEPFALCLVSRGWRLHLPGPPRPLLHFVLRGRGAVCGPDDSPQPLGPCWLAVVPPGVAHALECGEVQQELRPAPPPPDLPACGFVAGSADTAELVVACGLIRVLYGPSLGLFDHLGQVLTINLSDHPDVGRTFQRILEEQAHPAPAQTVMTSALMTQCLVHLFRRLARERNRSLPWLTALDDPRLARAVGEMLDHPALAHTVGSLAEAASMSRSAFASHFAAAFGRSPMSLLQHVRMQQAAHLLRRETLLSIDEVAGRVGYASRSHFVAAFRKHHGVAPATFRTAH